MSIVDLAIKVGLGMAGLAFGGKQLVSAANGVRDDIKKNKEQKENETSEETEE